MSASYTIYTRKNHATDTTGESITAIAINDHDGSKRQLTKPYNYALGVSDNHDVVANALDQKLTEEGILWDFQGYSEQYIQEQRDECAKYHLVNYELTNSGRGYRYRVTTK